MLTAQISRGPGVAARLLTLEMGAVRTWALQSSPHAAMKAAVFSSTHKGIFPLEFPAAAATDAYAIGIRSSYPERSSGHMSDLLVGTEFDITVHSARARIAR
jgi:hypothetical protein